MQRMLSPSRSNIKLTLIVVCAISIASINYFENALSRLNPFEDTTRQLQADSDESEEKIIGGFLVPESERIVPLSERKPESELRYASFGASATWGAAIPDRDTQAYVKVLSRENGDNYGIRSSGPNYPAACTETLLGDNEYDVIIFEYLNVASAGLQELAQRLRERFPDAIFVMLSVYDGEGLFKKFYCGDNTLMDLFKSSYKEYGRLFCHNPDYKAKAMEFFNENCPESLTAHGNYNKNLHGYLKYIAPKTGAYLEEDDGLVGTTGEGFLRYVETQKAYDCFHMSVEAHENTANKIKDLVRRIGVPKNPRVNPFSASDQCLNWFTDGKIDPSLQYSPNGFVEKMPNTQKYALTFKEDAMGKWIQMTNESDQKMFLFVSHMTTGPAPTNVKYPRAEATNDKGEVIAELDPVANWPGLEKNIHVTKLTGLGEVQPGETKKVYFRTLEKDSEWPLRIVQVLLTPKGNYNESYHGNKEKLIAES